MPTFEATVQTPWTKTKAFTYMADLANYDEWDPGTKRAELCDGDPGKPGAEYELTVGGKTLRYTITEAKRLDHIVAESHSKSLDSVDTITIGSRDAGTTVTYNAHLEFRGLSRLAAPLLSRRFHSMSEKAASGLADALDGAVIHQRFE